jgi:hypothetical protein
MTITEAATTTAATEAATTITVRDPLRIFWLAMC